VMLQSRMTVEEEEDVQNELASLQREAERIAVSHPVHFPLVPVTEPEASIGAATAEEESERVQVQERITLPA